ncbi:MAG TPA: hypothetical protein VGI08_13070 [Diaminobutyricibacter sp.]
MVAAIGTVLLAALITASRVGASTLYACVKKDGSAHIYSKKPKCKKREVKLSWSTEGPAGKNGANGLGGVNGKEGLQGPIGPQGPGATTFSFDATASATPTRVIVGTVPGGTVSADCFMPAPGEAMLRVYLQTSDGSWSVDYSYITDIKGTNATFTNHLAVPAGTLSKPTQVDVLTAGAAPFVSDRQLDFIQLAPAKAQMIWHERAESTTAPAEACHFSMLSYPSS